MGLGSWAGGQVLHNRNGQREEAKQPENLGDSQAPLNSLPEVADELSKFPS